VLATRGDNVLAARARVLGLNTYRHRNRPGLRRLNQTTHHVDDLAENSFHHCFAHHS